MKNVSHALFTAELMTLALLLIIESKGRRLARCGCQLRHFSAPDLPIFAAVSKKLKKDGKKPLTMVG